MSVMSVEDINHMQSQIQVARNEIKNLRQQIMGFKKSHHKEVEKILGICSDYERKLVSSASKQLKENSYCDPISQEAKGQVTGEWNFKPIGHLQSVFLYKNGTPRQPTICPNARAHLTIDKHVFNNPEHSLEGLQSFSHIWVMFVFHKNNNECTKAKVRPPRLLTGERVGLFSTRCPYRPNPIGLTLAKLEGVKGSTVYLSNVDILDGTPVLDIKPYIPEYDQPKPVSTLLLGQGHHDVDMAGKNVSPENETEFTLTSQMRTECTGASQMEAEQSVGDKLHPSCTAEDRHCNYISEELDLNSGLCCDGNKPTSMSSGVDEMVRGNDMAEHSHVKVANWISSPARRNLTVRFTATAMENLDIFSTEHSESAYRLKYFKNGCDLKVGIEDILQADPRSQYRRKQCSDSLYYFVIDIVHVTAWFDGNIAEVLKVQPSSNVDKLTSAKSDS